MFAGKTDERIVAGISTIALNPFCWLTNVCARFYVRIFMDLRFAHNIKMWLRMSETNLQKRLRAVTEIHKHDDWKLRKIKKLADEKRTYTKQIEKRGICVRIENFICICVLDFLVQFTRENRIVQRIFVTHFISLHACLTCPQGTNGNLSNF